MDVPLDTNRSTTLSAGPEATAVMTVVVA